MTLFPFSMVKKNVWLGALTCAPLLSGILLLHGCQSSPKQMFSMNEPHRAAEETPTKSSQARDIAQGLDSHASSDPFLASDQKRRSVETPSRPEVTPMRKASSVEQKQSRTPLAATRERQRAPEGVVRLTKNRQNQGLPFPSTSSSNKQHNTIQQVAFHEEEPEENKISPISYQHDARIPMANESSMADGGCPVMTTECGVVPCDPTNYPDEYLCDGGDRGYPFHYESSERAGLETEDTIAEYFDAQGKKHAKPSSRVCIYAPKFAAVRSMSSSLVAEDLAYAAGTHHGIRSAGIETHLELAEDAQRTVLDRIDRRSRASGVEAQAFNADLTQRQGLAAHQDLFAAYQNTLFVTTGRFRQADAAILAYAAQAAGMWTRDRNPQIYANDERGMEYRALFQANETIGIEESDRPGDLRIVKLADKQVAMPGDRIKFTIRFDNVGGQELYGVKIIDNLTPRLRYVDRSADSDHEGQLNIDDNGEGSEILEFVLDQPLRGGTGGVITFECEVR